MGGKIEVASTYGEGSTFRFYIEVGAPSVAPLATSNASDARPASAASDIAVPLATTNRQPGTSTLHMAPNRSFRIAIVEDNIINNKVLNKQMTKAKHTTKAAFNGLEGLEMIRGEDGKYNAFDCILMDIEMPILDGLTAVRQLRAEEADLNIPRNLCIALTGNARDAQKEMALEAGFDDVVSIKFHLLQFYRQHILIES